MDVFHGNLEAIETAGFCDLNFLAKALHLVVKHITVQREEQPFRQGILDTITLPSYHYRICLYF